MKAAVFYETGGPEVFRYEDVPDPVAPDDGVLIEVEVISIEGGDTLHRRSGEFTRFPVVVGYQCAGTVVGVGARASRFAVGDRVVTVGLDGSHAQLRAAPESFCWKVPDGASTEDAACVPVSFGTAHDCLFDLGGLEAGQTVLVQAGASGVGIAAIQLAKRAGATVLATASSDSKLERLKGLGVDHGINYAELSVPDEVTAITSGTGVDVVIESVGGRAIAESIGCLAYKGTCVSLGDAGRDGPSVIDVAVLRPNNLTVKGYFLGMELLLGTSSYDAIESILADVAAGDLKVIVDSRFALADAEAAHRRIESRRAFGRVVLVP